jgi:hypothetical protein
VNTRKIFLAAWGPIKTILIIWGFLLLIITFIYFIFFEENGLFNFLLDRPLTFNVVSAIVAGFLFLFWLIVWNTLIKAFFKEDLQFMEKNGFKLAEANG